MGNAALSRPVFQDVRFRAEAAGLIVMGTVPAGADMPGPIVLLGAGPGFWQAFRTSPEGADNAPDPVDRWSVRVISALARDLKADPHFPFGGPPYEPFIAWAKASGRAWSSPTGMLVHDTVGLMISYRGALAFGGPLSGVPQACAASPCIACDRQPCLTACPVDALGADHAYDVPACHAFLATPEGTDCMTRGCAVRRACPVSRGAGRSPAQSAHHMKAFHPS
ncbi:ferredoxin [Chachezhania sediminis]|uniref:ferredoxin n=1 Tax=Chachezhania sediminis TaxID=2599291 RepID=UPI00131DCE43|nr:ferredoxin [Chachezhania sediminis]